MIKRMGIFVLLVFLICACGSKQSAEIQVELFSQKNEIKYFLEMVASEFHEDNPNIKININSPKDSKNILRNRMTDKVESPHLMNIEPLSKEFKEWAKNGHFVDLSEIQARKNLMDGKAEAYKINDKIFAIPFSTNVSGYFYNVDKFKELGLRVPNNWEEMENLVFKIKDKGYTPFSLSLTPEDSWILDGIHQMIWNSVSGYEQAHETLIASPKDAIIISDKNLQQVMTALRLFSPDNAQKNSKKASASDSIATFVKGDALILPHGSWALSDIRKLKPKFQVSMFGQPKMKEHGHLTMGAADFSLSVSSHKSPEEQEAAIQFIDFFASKSVIQRYHKQDGSPLFVKDIETRGVNPELEEVSKLINQKEYNIWLSPEWPMEAKWGLTAINFILDHDEEAFTKSLNDFFNEGK